MIVLAVCILLVLAMIMNPGAFKKIWGAGRAQVGKAGRVAEDADPLANFQQQVDDAAVALEGQLNAQKLVEANLESLNRQVADGLKEEARLKSRIQAAVDKGDPNGTAKKNALELAAVREHLAANQEQLKIQQASAQQTATMVDMNRKKIVDARNLAHQKGLELQQSEAMKRSVAQFAQLTGTDLFNGLGTTMDKLQQKIDANKASAKVDQQAFAGTLADMKDEQDERDAAADDILAEFKKKTPEPTASTTT
jgi:hypothetical protein